MEQSRLTALDQEVSPNTPGTVPTDTTGPATLTPDPREEALVEDVRASLTPAQMVERKLVSLLKSNPLPVSHMMSGRRTIRAR